MERARAHELCIWASQHDQRRHPSNEICQGRRALPGPAYSVATRSPPLPSSCASWTPPRVARRHRTSVRSLRSSAGSHLEVQSSDISAAPRDRVNRSHKHPVYQFASVYTSGLSRRSGCRPRHRIVSTRQTRSPSVYCDPMPYLSTSALNESSHRMSAFPGDKYGSSPAS
ncbi:hypothetical protein BV25DRAFT_1469195 [Artomyces pyxidatus]|uniref:Uncharacterized protein n=1 Tax=Artomyces pyxidatus TaxID=48021 RepID=A0ACB8SKM0_9AGAM|nr:hypothetical protein BV25DRAFT_1469195 [Artomyces pyxidatus]